jgi:gas vesicle protein
VAEGTQQIRSEIETTRERVGETVDALAYKADVPTRTKNWLEEKKDAVTSRVSGVTPDGQEVKQRVGSMKDTAERNPIGLAVGGAAVGFVMGMLVPSTRVEDERLGAAADEVKSTAVDAGREALDRGKEVAQEAGQAAMETAKERGREQTQELSDSLQERVQDASPSTTETTQPSSSSRPV